MPSSFVMHFLPLFWFACSSHTAKPVELSSSCQEILAEKPVLELTVENYSCTFSGDKPVLVDINATWCGPCREMKPYVESYEMLYEDRVRVTTLTEGTNPAFEQLYPSLIPDLWGFPTTLFVYGEKRSVRVGALSLSDITALAERYFHVLPLEPAVAKECLTQIYLAKKGLQEQRYLLNFSIDDIADLTFCDLPPSVANPYGERFLGKSICWMHAHEYTADFIAKYDSEYTGKEVMLFLFRKVSPEEANKQLHP